MIYEALYRSSYFTLYQAKKGVYAAVAVDGAGALGNAGIVDLGNHTLIFDTFQSPVAAALLKDAAKAITGKAPSFVVNSHWHFDHVLGNQVFRESSIISTATTREAMRELVPNFLQTVQHNRRYPVLLKKEASATNDYQKRKELLQSASDAQHLADHIDDLELTLPNMTVQHDLCLYGTLRSAVIMNMGRCHSEEDVVLYLPEDGIVFAGDLISHCFHPALKNGNIEQWMQSLKRLSSLEADIIVPGHGEIALAQQVEEMREYFSDLQRTARIWKAWGEGMEEQAIPEKYKHWQGPSIYYDNLQMLSETK
ncbi:MAG: MBL fold metallo-hydrolase [Ectobacillus sp.]